MLHIIPGLYQGFTDFLFLNRLHQIIGTSEGQRFSGKCKALMTGLENTFNIYFSSRSQRSSDSPLPKGISISVTTTSITSSSRIFFASAALDAVKPDPPDLSGPPLPSEARPVPVFHHPPVKPSSFTASSRCSSGSHISTAAPPSVPFSNFISASP